MTGPFLQAAIDKARAGLAEGGISIGSVIVHRGRIIGRGVAVEVRQDDTCIALMRDFIVAKPQLWNEDIGV